MEDVFLMHIHFLLFLDAPVNCCIKAIGTCTYCHICISLLLATGSCHLIPVKGKTNRLLFRAPDM